MPRSEKEGLLSRWSRLKRESSTAGNESSELSNVPGTAAAPPDASAWDGGEASEDAGTQALPELPSLESLTPDSDFRAFMDPRVDDGVRRAALKTLFRSPGFNLSDGLDEYAGDYTKLETLTPAMVAALKHTQRTLFGKRDEPGDHESNDPDAVHPDAPRSETIKLAGEDHSIASRGEKQRSHERRDGGDRGDGEPGGRSTGGVDTAIVPENAAGGDASEKIDRQAGIDRHE